MFGKLSVSPAHAGVEAADDGGTIWEWRQPRARGGRGEIVELFITEGGSAPRTRG